MYDTKIYILFIANGFLITFIRQGKLLNSLMIKYEQKGYNRLSKLACKIKDEHEFEKAEVTIKRGIGSKDVEKVIDTLQKSGIQIVCMNEVNSIPHNTYRQIIKTKEGNNNGKQN